MEDCSLAMLSTGVSAVPKKNKVLIVEDDQPIGEVLAELLLDEGYKVSSASNGEEALELLRKSEEKPDLILLDLMMPIKDGLQFRKEQLEDLEIADIPVVVMSADRNIQQKLQEMKSQDFIKKPLSIESLLQTLAHYCH